MLGILILINESCSMNRRGGDRNGEVSNEQTFKTTKTDFHFKVELPHHVSICIFVPCLHTTNKLIALWKGITMWKKEEICKCAFIVKISGPQNSGYCLLVTT